MRRTFQVSLVVVGAIPLLLGIVNFTIGSGRIVPEDQVTPNLDSMWRFYSIWFTVAFFLAIWCARNIDISGPVMRIMFSVMAVGGLARIYSIHDVGVPEAPMIGAIIIEIGVLAFIPWHNAIIARQRALPAE